jgi:hypothetical protein
MKLDGLHHVSAIIAARDGHTHLHGVRQSPGDIAEHWRKPTPLTLEWRAARLTRRPARGGIGEQTDA